MREMQVLIKRSKSGQWQLIVRKHGQVFRVWTHNRLINALDMASTLQLHVSNVNELPLSQYLQGAA